MSQARLESGAIPFAINAPPVEPWGPVFGELQRIRNFESDWDGERTEAPGPALLDAAIRLAQKLSSNGEPAADRVCASVNATVYFEWHLPSGYREIEIVSPERAECRWLGGMGTEASRDEYIVCGARKYMPLSTENQSCRVIRNMRRRRELKKMRQRQPAKEPRNNNLVK